MRTKTNFYRTLLLLVCVVIVSTAITSCQNPASQRYRYADATAHLPGRLSSGGMLTITWRAYPERSTEQETPPVTMTLTMMLVAKTDFSRGMCGNYHRSILLDVMTVSDHDHQDLQRLIVIPQSTPVGAYELVWQVKGGQVSTCQANPLMVDALSGKRDEI